MVNINLNLEAMFEAVKGELIRLLQERDDTLRRRAEIDQQLSGLKQTVTGLLHYSKGLPDNRRAGSQAFKALLDRVDDASPALTLTQACRRAFKTSAKPLCAADLKTYLEDAGYNFEAYKSNPLISIHSAIKRMAETKEIEVASNDGNTTYYRVPKPTAMVDISKLNFSTLAGPLNLGDASIYNDPLVSPLDYLAGLTKKEKQ